MMYRTLCIAVVGFTCACASRPTSGATVEPTTRISSDERSARCAAVADSVRASALTADLPLAVPRGRPAIPIPHGGATGEVRAVFLVSPAGRAVQGTIVTTGATDPEFRRAMEEVIMRTPFRPPTVSGCSTWGHGDFRVRSEIGPR